MEYEKSKDNSKQLFFINYQKLWDSRNEISYTDGELYIHIYRNDVVYLEVVGTMVIAFIFSMLTAYHIIPPKLCAVLIFITSVAFVTVMRLLKTEDNDIDCRIHLGKRLKKDQTIDQLIDFIKNNNIIIYINGNLVEVNLKDYANIIKKGLSLFNERLNSIIDIIIKSIPKLSSK